LADVFEAGYYHSYHGKLETNYIIFGHVEIFITSKNFKEKNNWGWKIENRKEYSGIFCSPKWNHPLNTQLWMNLN
jgi:predicted glycosyltransferase involved in capsule biosynthesis